ncbi:zinc metallopeptidase [Microgenomates group bacterium]|nr:zinc metallopeptidase [Microgenomates group bacterium]
MPFDPTYIYLVLPALLFAMWAQYMVTSSFKAYSKKRTTNGMTGAQAAEAVLRELKVSGVKIERTGGNLTDHFDPKTKTIRLSESVYNSPSIAAVGVAAHEAGHAAQYAAKYGPMKVRAAIIPVTNLGSSLAVPLVLLGTALGVAGLIDLGILMFGVVVVFQVITLPVEFNASRRAMAVLDESKLLAKDELGGAGRVLNAAALTYVGALVVSLTQLVRLAGMRKRRR